MDLNKKYIKAESIMVLKASIVPLFLVVWYLLVQSPNPSNYAWSQNSSIRLLFVSVLSHGNELHVLNNSLGLLLIFYINEKYVGKSLLLLISVGIIAGMGASAFTSVLIQQPIIGFSTAIYSMMAFLTIIIYNMIRSKQHISEFVPMLFGMLISYFLIAVFNAAVFGNMSSLAHLIGYLTGIISYGYIVLIEGNIEIDI